MIEVAGIPLLIREARPSDHAYMGRTWIRASHRDGWEPWARVMVRQALELDRVRVACYADDEDMIAGYAVGRAGAAVYTYVQGNPALNLRGKGLGRALIEEVSRETTAG